MQAFQVAISLHVLGVILWLGGFLHVARILLLREREPDPAFRDRLAGEARHAAMLPDVGMTLAILSGLYLLFANDAILLHMPYMHVKLPLAVLVVAGTVLLRIKAKRATRNEGRMTAALPAAVGALVVAIVLAVFLKF